MVRLQLHKSALDDFNWLIIAGNAYQFSSGTYRFDDQIQNGFEQIVVLVNAVIMYLPVLMPSGNKDSRSFSPVEGLLIGIGGALGVVPGISSMGATTSILLLRGADRTFALNMALLLQMAVNAGMLVMDIVAMWTLGIGVISFGGIVCCILAAAAAFAGVFLGIKAMRMLAVNIGFNIFAFYSLGVALFSFILFLTA